MRRTGLLGVALFAISIIIFGLLDPNFLFINSYISELGAQDASRALLLNLFGFVIPGILLAVFGWSFGQDIGDRITGLLMGAFGLAFAFTAIPIDSLSQDTPYAKAHILAICLALAAWLFGLARITGLKNISAPTKKRANVSAVLLVMIMVSGTLDLWPMPITHRLVFSIVFGWTLLTSLASKKEMTQNNP